MCGSSVDGDVHCGYVVQVSVSSQSCLVEAVCCWFLVSFAWAMFCVIRGGARPLLLSLCNAHHNMCRIREKGKSTCLGCGLWVK